MVPGLESLPTKGEILGGDAIGIEGLSKTSGGVLITGLPAKPVNAAATVLAFDFDQAPDVAPYRVYAATDGSFMLEPADAMVKGAKYHDNEMFRRSNIDSWKAKSEATFPLQVEKAGSYQVEIEVATDRLKDDAEFVISVGDVEQPVAVKSTGDPKVYESISAGSIELPAGKVELELRCKSIVKKGIVKVASVTLKPAE